MIDDVRLLEDIEQGAQGGPTFSTSVIVLSSGAEVRNQNWSREKLTWDIAYGIDSAETYAAVRDFFYARAGRARGFRFKDWTDFVGTAEPLVGTADGSNKNFQLTRNYISGSVTFQRKITRVVSGTLKVYNNGSLVSGGAYTETLGLIAFTAAPAAGHAITADFEFDIPVRFDTDSLVIAAQLQDVWEFQSIPIVSVVE